jgi:hypothetical protein
MLVISKCSQKHFLAIWLLHGVNHVAYKICLTSIVMIWTNVFTHLTDYSDIVTVSRLSFKKLVEIVGTSVTVMSMMAEVAHLNSVEQHITASIKNKVYFEWIRSTSCLFYHQPVDGILRGVTIIYIPWWCKQRNRFKTEAPRQRDTKRKMKILAYKSLIK